jgi:GTP-binding protein Era
LEKSDFRSGYVAIVGKPNAGKSTLLNALLGTHLSIATHKAQTTRHQITGILSEEKMQVVFLDTPGLIKPKYKLQEYMMKFVEKAKREADIILLLSDVLDSKFENDDYNLLNGLGKKVVVVLNKIDKATQEQVEKQFNYFEELLKPVEKMALSALEEKGLDHLKDEIYKLLPPGPAYYPDDELSIHPMRFFASELIREQLFLLYQEEVPYMSQVEVTAYDEDEKIDRIYAEVIVSRSSQKGIIIGKGGSALKKMGTNARKAIENFTGKKVFLDLHVKVREGWRDKDSFLKNFGYSEE